MSVQVLFPNPCLTDLGCYLTQYLMSERYFFQQYSSSYLSVVKTKSWQKLNLNQLDRAELLKWPFLSPEPLASLRRWSLGTGRKWLRRHAIWLVRSWSFLECDFSWIQPLVPSRNINWLIPYWIKIIYKLSGSLKLAYGNNYNNVVHSETSERHFWIKFYFYFRFFVNLSKIRKTNWSPK